MQALFSGKAPPQLGYPTATFEITQLLQRIDGFPASVKVWHSA